MRRAMDCCGRSVTASGNLDQWRQRNSHHTGSTHARQRSGDDLQRRDHGKFRPGLFLGILNWWVQDGVQGSAAEHGILQVII